MQECATATCYVYQPVAVVPAELTQSKFTLLFMIIAVVVSPEGTCVFVFIVCQSLMDLTTFSVCDDHQRNILLTDLHDCVCCACDRST